MAPIRDDNKPPYTAWYLVVTGHIQSGTFEYSDGICCLFDIVSTKKEWEAISVSHHKEASCLTEHLNIGES